MPSHGLVHRRRIWQLGLLASDDGTHVFNATRCNMPRRARKTSLKNSMDIRRITPDYAVAPQILPEDMATLAAEGFTVVINNRPDAEITPDICCDEMRKAAEAAGLRYVTNPVENGGMTMAMVENQGRVVNDADGPVFAWCRSGTRSSIVWALSQAGTLPRDEIMQALRTAGYDLPQLAGQIDALAQR